MKLVQIQTNRLFQSKTFLILRLFKLLFLLYFSRSVECLLITSNYRPRKEGDPNYVINVTNQKKNPLQHRFGSPGQQNSIVTSQKFIGEMKRHGIYDALNEMNKFSEFFEALPEKLVDSKDEKVKEHEQSHSSNNFTESQSTQMMSSSAFMDTKDHNTVGSSKLEIHKARFDEKESSDKLHFLFPFQRRARSHSPPSEEQIHNKIAETITNNIKPQKERRWSKNNENKNASPVVANTSFIIGGVDFHKNRRLGDRARKGITKEERR